MGEILNIEKDFKNNVQARLSLRLLDKYNPNNFIKEIEKKLKDINEIFNMLHWKYTDIPAESIKLTTDPRFNR